MRAALLPNPPPEVGIASARQRRRHQGLARKSAEELPVLREVQSRFDAPGLQHREHVRREHLPLAFLAAPHVALRVRLQADRTYQRVGPEDLRHDNAAALLAGLENPSPTTLPELVGAVCRRLRAPELRELRDVMLAWAGWRARQAGLRIEDEDMAQVNRMENPDDIEAFYMTRAQIWEEERRAEGRAEGRIMGQRESLRRHAAMKFDAQTAARLGAVLEDVTEAAAFDGVLAALLECDTPSELLARAAEPRRRTNGRNLPADC